MYAIIHVELKGVRVRVIKCVPTLEMAQTFLEGFRRAYSATVRYDGRVYVIDALGNYIQIVAVEN